MYISLSRPDCGEWLYCDRFILFSTDCFLLKIDMDTPERGVLRNANAGKNEHGDEEANLGAVKEQLGSQSENSSGRDGTA